MNSDDDTGNNNNDEAVQAGDNNNDTDDTSQGPQVQDERMSASVSEASPGSPHPHTSRSRSPDRSRSRDRSRSPLRSRSPSIGEDAIIRSSDNNVEEPVSLPGGSTDDLANKLSEAISKNIIKLFSNDVEFQHEGENLSKIVAKRTVELINQKNATNVLLAEAFWNQDENGAIVCLVCQKHAVNNNCPVHLRRARRDKFGMFSAARDRANRERMTAHLKHPFHVWAVEEEKWDKKEKVEKKEKNRQAATMLVTNVMHCFKDSSATSVDFVRLNNKDQLCELIGEKFAFKNDGRQHYFSLRETAFIKLTEQVKKIIQGVSVIAVTLDKVTTASTPFTVVLTYFFYEGKIYAVLNEVYAMHTDELDGEGTANLLVTCLKKTLGLSEEEIAGKLEHVVFDGVYEEAENRPRGGGSLCLVSHLSEKLQVGPDVMTGTWDYGHRIQLVLKDCLQDGKSSKTYQDVTDFMYNLMSKYRDDKNAMVFKETADELNIAILKNQKKSDTRWARKDLSSKVTFFRNAPTMHTVLGREAEESRRNMNNTKMKEILKISNRLQDPSFWLHGIGYTMILDKVSQVSLNAQRVGAFPTTIYGLLLNTIADLEQLGEKWQWSSHLVCETNIGSPIDLVSQLKRGTFEPQLSEIARSRAAGTINARRQNMSDHFDDDFVPMSSADIQTGEIPIDLPETEEEWDRLEDSVKTELQSKVLELVDHMKKRFNTEKDSLVAVAQGVFNGSNNWLADLMEFEGTGIDEENNDDERRRIWLRRNGSRCMDVLLPVWHKMDPKCRSALDLDAVVYGYVDY